MWVSVGLQLLDLHQLSYRGILTQLCNPARFIHTTVANKSKKKDNNDNNKENGLTMKNEMTMKEKRFSFFADQQ